MGPELPAVGRLSNVGVTGTKNFLKERVRAKKKIEAVFSASQNFFRQTLEKRVFFGNRSFFSEVDFSISEKLCPAPSPSSNASLLSPLSNFMLGPSLVGQLCVPQGQIVLTQPKSAETI